jgi:hypothetical protein
VGESGTVRAGERVAPSEAIGQAGGDSPPHYDRLHAGDVGENRAGLENRTQPIDELKGNVWWSGQDYERSAANGPLRRIGQLGDGRGRDRGDALRGLRRIPHDAGDARQASLPRQGAADRTESNDGERIRTHGRES